MPTKSKSKFWSVCKTEILANLSLWEINQFTLTREKMKLLRQLLFFASLLIDFHDRTWMGQVGDTWRRGTFRFSSTYSSVNFQRNKALVRDRPAIKVLVSRLQHSNEIGSNFFFLTGNLLKVEIQLDFLFIPAVR